MIEHIIRWSITNRVLVLILTGFVTAGAASTLCGKHQSMRCRISPTYKSLSRRRSRGRRHKLSKTR
jgi:hypothetical protein